MILSDLAKCLMTRSVVQSLCDSWASFRIFGFGIILFRSYFVCNSDVICTCVAHMFHFMIMLGIKYDICSMLPIIISCMDVSIQSTGYSYVIWRVWLDNSCWVSFDYTVNEYAQFIWYGHCESHLRWATFLPNLGTLGLWVLESFAMYSMDGQKRRFLPPSLQAGA